MGSYLSEIYPKENLPFQGGLERIRNRYTTRKMYVDEFELIWEKQKQFHSTLNEDLKTLFGGRKLDGYKEEGILFHQRPLRSQKHLVGFCTFENELKDENGKYIRKGLTKCPISAIPFELFRVWQWVNTVAVSYTHLDVYKRQPLWFAAMRRHSASPIPDPGYMSRPCRRLNTSNICSVYFTSKPIPLSATVMR